MNAVLVLLVLLLSMCGGNLRVDHPPNPQARTLRQQVYVDAAFTADEKQEIQVALDTWNHTLNGATFYYIADAYWKPIQVLDDETVLNERDGMKFIRRTSDEEGRPGLLGKVPALFDEHIFLVVDTIAACCDLHSVAAHEMGHAMGLEHNNFPGSLMYPHYTNQGTPENGRCVDEITARSLSEVYRDLDPNRYPLEHLSYCRLPQ